ncbi:MAG TPA: TlpA disulfide reductase family protein [Spirochaetia bacterium]|nr:TlpA disulfide reductase family protein [Spirochaetales bacterium]HRY80392.1 TlpA disulfide reductase family protein [Spirochaetia bacterium]HRZ88528.1 TlpA disulfide reductase family protein [Spirochaetia bacterium]
MKYVFPILIAVAVLAGGCSRAERTGTASSSDSPAGAVPSGAPAAAPVSASVPETPSSRPWYADRFEALGFYVFPAPVELPSFSVQPRAGGPALVPAALKGKVTLLNFWATWCPPCREEMPSIEKLHSALRGEAFAVAAISVKEDAKTVDGFLKQYPYTFPIYLDPTGAASGNFVTRGIPTTFVLDKDARAIAAIIGSRPYDEPEVISLFRDLARR